MTSDTPFTLEPLTVGQLALIQENLGMPVCSLDRSRFVGDAVPNLGVTALICRDRDDISGVLRLCPSLRFLYVVSAGVEKLPFRELADRGIIVCNASGANAEVMSQYAIAQILAHSTKVRDSLKSQQRHSWTKFQCTEDLRGKTLFVAGAGRSGTLLAQKAKAFGLQVVGSSYPVRRIDPFDDIVSLEEFDARISEADYVVCALPLTEQTRRHFNRRLFSGMRSTAVFINMSRGGLVKLDDLVTVLREGRLACAVLDVFDEEPVPVESDLWEVENLYVTPHMAGRMVNFMDEAIRLFCLNYKAFLEGMALPNKVNLENGF